MMPLWERYQPCLVTTDSFDGSVRRFLSLMNRDRLKSGLCYLLDEEEFLSRPVFG